MTFSRLTPDPDTFTIPGCVRSLDSNGASACGPRIPGGLVGKFAPTTANLNPRAYFERFAGLVEETGVNRAVVLMGPRRVGKTVLLHHVIQRLLGGDQYKARDIGYISLDHPLYTRLSIEEAANEIRRSSGNPNGLRMLILDEIQYLADWERHLKVFVDAHPDVKCVVSGSAAAALRLRSVESGVGRFTDFLLPPLTFHEYLDLQGVEDSRRGRSGPWIQDQ